jgi:hypothetical protein
MNEIWKDVKDYEGRYQVSSLGRVKSLPKEWFSGINTIRRHNGKILKLRDNSRGYYKVALSNRGVVKECKVHQLVAIAFLGHTPCGYSLVIDHINDNSKDNRVENLQIVTARFNAYKTQGKGSSKYKGVYWCNTNKRFKAVIRINGKSTYLGSFKKEYEAHLAYQNKLKEIL